MLLAQEWQAAQPEQAQVQAIWEKLIALYDTKIYPGISFSRQRRGKVVMQRALGYSHGHGSDDVPNAEKRRMTPQTPVCLFSTSKAVTAAIVTAYHSPW